MLRKLPRALCFGLALAFGVLVAAWRPVEAQGASPVILVPASVVVQVVAASAESTLPDAWQHDEHCPPHLSASGDGHHRGPSWHRGTGRRSHRDPSGLWLFSSRAGSIPACDPLYSQRPVWHLVPRPPVHGTGQLAAPPRAPPR